MERELFICQCENTEHQIVFSWFEDDDLAVVYATIHLRKKSFWERLKYGLKYIFGYQCKYGAFDEFIFNPEDAHKLKKIYQFLSDTHEDKVMEEKMESVARIEKAYKEGRLPVAIKTYKKNPANTQGNEDTH